ncbi:probable salivary secreted peptide [Ischnura elegans]|uniref:probable salivary secreted peptide n=1 Tax=Ischnura elegans TaxID=197161 RepID=UPI001ED8A132|nr:probable salivary secreted peptide [Ischnura elegans]
MPRATPMFLLPLLLLLVGPTWAQDPLDEVFPPRQPRQPHDLILCDMKPGDQLLMRTQVKQKGQFLSYVDMDFMYPPVIGYEFTEVIHCIKVTDKVSDGNGGYATIKSGGLNQNAVTINLRSQLGKGIEFILEVYGQDPTAAPPAATTDSNN